MGRCWPDRRDGRLGGPRNRSAFELERVRDGELQARGYHVVRFTYWQVTAEPEYVVRVLRQFSRGG